MVEADEASIGITIVAIQDLSRFAVNRHLAADGNAMSSGRDAELQTLSGNDAGCGGSA
jgi:hypothetical protein